jgi:hypothetical protein
LQQLGRLEEALTSFERALSIDPDYGDCRTNREAVLKLLGREQRASDPAPLTSTVVEVPGYVISLARRPDRRERFLRWNAGKGIDISVFDAVDGRTLDKKALLRANVIDALDLNFTMGFLGSAMSHRALWEKCIALGQPILIFEDDVFLPDTFRDWIQPALAELAGGCDMVFLGYNRDAILSVGYGAGQWCNIVFEAPSVGFEQEAEQHSRWSQAKSPRHPSGLGDHGLCHLARQCRGAAAALFPAVQQAVGADVRFGPNAGALRGRRRGQPGDPARADQGAGGLSAAGHRSERPSRFRQLQPSRLIHSWLWSLTDMVRVLEDWEAERAMKLSDRLIG